MAPRTPERASKTRPRMIFEGFWEPRCLHVGSFFGRFVARVFGQCCNRSLNRLLLALGLPFGSILASCPMFLQLLGRLFPQRLILQKPVKKADGFLYFLKLTTSKIKSCLLFLCNVFASCLGLFVHRLWYHFASVWFPFGSTWEPFWLQISIVFAFVF